MEIIDTEKGRLMSLFMCVLSIMLFLIATYSHFFCDGCANPTVATTLKSLYSPVLYSSCRLYTWDTDLINRKSKEDVVTVPQWVIGRQSLGGVVQKHDSSEN